MTTINSSKPPGPRKAHLPSGFRASQLGALQELMEQNGYTVISYNLAAIPAIYFAQKATGTELALIERAADLLRKPSYDFWMEFHWVPNDEDDRHIFPERIDTVVIKRSPTVAPTEEKADALWRPVIDHFPKGNDGWLVELDHRSGFVTLRYGKALSLPAFTPYDFSLEVTHKSIPFAITERWELLCLGALESNMLFGGSPGSGKSGGLTAYLAGVARLPNVAIIGLDPKRVEQAVWASRFSFVAKDGETALEVLQKMNEEMDRRYVWLEENGLKKLTARDLSIVRPMIVLAIDELADLVASGLTPDEKKADGMRIGLIRRLIALGRAAGIVVLAATQKPQSDVVPTAIRDLIQLRIAYATTNSDMTDTILGKGMSALGAAAHRIAPSEKGVCYIINESSRTPIKALTFWIPDEDVKPIAEKYAHLRIQLDWLAPAPSNLSKPSVVDATPPDVAALSFSALIAQDFSK